MPKETLICNDCQHIKGQHSAKGCTHTYVNGQVCPCSNKRLASHLSKYVMGIPLDD